MEKVNHILVTSKDSIKYAMQSMNVSIFQIALVVDEHGKLERTI